jgi:hypothetical protein
MVECPRAYNTWLRMHLTDVGHLESQHILLGITLSKKVVDLLGFERAGYKILIREL